MPQYSRQSLEILSTCRPEIQTVLKEVIRVIDNTVIWGHRNKQYQDTAFSSGKSKVRWPHSKHNRYPSEAVDIAPYLSGYGTLYGSEAQINAIARREHTSTIIVGRWIREQYVYLAGYVMGLAGIKGYKFRWGNDWNMDFNLLNNKFDDLGHFEIILPKE